MKELRVESCKFKEFELASPPLTPLRGTRWRLRKQFALGPKGGLPPGNSFNFRSTTFIFLLLLFNFQFITPNSALAQTIPTPPTPTIAQQTAPKPTKPESNLARPRAAHLILAGGGVGLPFGEMRARFGAHGFAGLGYQYLWPSKWTLGTDAAFGFGDKIKQDPISILRDGTGMVVGADGSPASITVSERFVLGPGIKGGRLWVLRTKHAPRQFELGLMGQAGVQYLTYWYQYQDLGRQVPLLDKTNRRGFDRMQSGLGPLAELTLLALAPTGRYAFFATLSGLAAFTQSQRSYDYNDGRADLVTKTNLVLNLRVGLALTLFTLDDKDYFYY